MSKPLSALVPAAAGSKPLPALVPTAAGSKPLPALDPAPAGSKPLPAIVPAAAGAVAAVAVALLLGWPGRPPLTGTATVAAAVALAVVAVLLVLRLATAARRPRVHIAHRPGPPGSADPSGWLRSADAHRVGFTHTRGDVREPPTVGVRLVGQATGRSTGRF
ncbi:MAG: hypothetical protein JOY78_12990 [Pseudonocardia sp.]|nr:hypothetical protein [Pseudonocardia sp.]